MRPTRASDHLPLRLRNFCQRRKFYFTFISVIAIVATAIITTAVVAGRYSSTQKSVNSVLSPGFIQAPDTAQLPKSEYVQQALLSPQLRNALRIIGDRLETRSKERLTLIGTIKRLNVSTVAANIRLIIERPNRLRFEEQDGNKLTITVFDGKTIAKSGGELKDSDEDEIETLLFDSVEHFFLGEIQGQGTRFLGSRFRLDDGASPDYTGPFYEIFQTGDRIDFGEKSRTQEKLYFLNSDNLLFERISYRIDRQGKPVHIEVQLSDWMPLVEGQLLPSTIARFENGNPVLALSFTSASLSPKQSDDLLNLSPR